MASRHLQAPSNYRCTSSLFRIGTSCLHISHLAFFRCCKSSMHQHVLGCIWLFTDIHLLCNYRSFVSIQKSRKWLRLTHTHIQILPWSNTQEYNVLPFQPCPFYTAIYHNSHNLGLHCCFPQLPQQNGQEGTHPNTCILHLMELFQPNLAISSFLVTCAGVIIWTWCPNE